MVDAFHEVNTQAYSDRECNPGMDRQPAQVDEMKLKS